MTAGGAPQREAAKLWSVADGVCLRTFHCGDPSDGGGSGSEVAVAFSASSGLLVTAMNRGVATVWSVADGSCKHTFEHHKEGEGRLTAVALTGALA